MLVAAAVLAASSGLGLAPVTEAVDHPVPPPQPSPPAVPVPALPVGGAAGAAALLTIVSRRRGSAVGPAPGDALGLEPPGEPIVVFVPGHGQASGDEAFHDLVDLMGLGPSDAYFFDYRWVTGDASHSHAAMDAGIDDSVAALNAFVAGLAVQERPIFLVGFSKGGATVAELVADWDEGQAGPAHAVSGAALLDPPIASGAHGWLQSLGRHLGPVPDDGGYEPEQCVLFSMGCRDRREHLGDASGVEVLVVKNPKSPLTNFGDRPAGLRVYDAPDDGPDLVGQMLGDPLGLPKRVSAAHESVLHDPEVARCLVDEMSDPGSCSLGEASPFDYPAPIEPPMGRSVL